MSIPFIFRSIPYKIRTTIPTSFHSNLQSIHYKIHFIQPNTTLISLICYFDYNVQCLNFIEVRLVWFYKQKLWTNKNFEGIILHSRLPSPSLPLTVTRYLWATKSITWPYRGPGPCPWTTTLHSKYSNQIKVHELVHEPFNSTSRRLPMPFEFVIGQVKHEEIIRWMPSRPYPALAIQINLHQQEINKNTEQRIIMKFNHLKHNHGSHCSCCVGCSRRRWVTSWSESSHISPKIISTIKTLIQSIQVE